MARLTRQKKHHIREVLNKAMAARIRTTNAAETLTSGPDMPEVSEDELEYAKNWINTTAAMVGRESTVTETEGT
jgi:hypothetical protein